MIVSHAASYPLAQRAGVLRVLVTASDETREERVAEDDGVDAKEARKRLAESDKGRAAYLERFYGVKREQPTDYDVVVNTDRYERRPRPRRSSPLRPPRSPEQAQRCASIRASASSRRQATLGVLLHDRPERPACDRPRDERRLGGDGRGAGGVDDQRDLAEVVAGAERPALLAVDRDLRRPLLDHEEADPLGALDRERAGPASTWRSRHRAGDLAQLPVIQVGEQRDPAEQLDGASAIAGV